VEKDLPIDMLVSGEGEGIRLDAFVAGAIGVGRGPAARAVEQGRIRVDGLARKPSFRLKQGMRVQGACPAPRQAGPVEPVGIPLEVLYEDEWIVVVNKPAGMSVHPGAGASGPTLAGALIARYPEMALVGDPERPGIVHRLDKLTTGVMVAARNAHAHAVLSRAFKAHEHTRIYLALCWGSPGKDSGTIETFMQRNPKDRTRMTSRAKEGRRAVTHWEVLKRWRDFALLRLKLETGRTHQIRVHLAESGHPVAGDPVYGPRRRARTIPDPRVRSALEALSRQMLHASLLGIRHPATGEYLEFTSEPPEDMRAFMSALDAAQEGS